MKKNTSDGKSLVKLETTILIAVITLVIGFVGGVVFSAFRMGSSVPSAATMSTAMQGKSSGVQTPTPEERKRIANLEKTVAKTPGDAASWIALGNAYFDLNQVKKAIHAYETALKYQPKDANVLTDLGVMYRRDGQPKKAIASFDKALAVDPKHEASLFDKGIVQMHDLNDPKGAAESWSKLLEIDPNATAPNGMPIKDLVEKLKNIK